jgi:RND family efflux transporter MFP subunit
MNTRRAALLSLTLAACSGGSEKLTQLPSADTPATADALHVSTLTATSSVITRDVIATGTLEPAREANIGPQMTARVANVLVKEGDNVVSGAPLIQLDSVEASLRAQQLAANVASSESQYELAKNEYERLAPLAEKGTITAQQMERLSRQRDALKAASEAARIAEADAKRHMTNASVRAPFGGIVSKVYVEVGEVATMMPVTLLVRLVDLSSVDVRVRVHERELAGVVIGSAASAKMSATGETAEGKVTFISPEIDARTRTAEVVTRIPNPDKRLRAGMFAEIAIKPLRSHEGVTLPASAVAGTGASRYVFVLKGDVVERTKVRVTPVGTDSFEILEGVAPGTEVVREGLGRLTDGAKVERTEAAQIKAAPTAAAADVQPKAPEATP